MIARPNLNKQLLRLRDFQRDTVEYVFRKMYGESGATRFLVADEVGLGKTFVARGLIAKIVDHLWDKVDRIDIIYICSNSSIARQNINRLNITDANDVALPSRITLLPTVVHDLERNKLNLVSLTPQTSLDLRSSLGLAEERALLFWLCRKSGSHLRRLHVTRFRDRQTESDFATALRTLTVTESIKACCQNT